MLTELDFETLGGGSCLIDQCESERRGATVDLPIPLVPSGPERSRAERGELLV